MEIQRISRIRFLHTIGWAVLGSCLLVAIMATLGRASYNFSAALTDKPDIAIYMLLEDRDLQETKLIREVSEQERHYYAESKDGPLLVVLRRGPKEWYVDSVEELRE